MRRRFVTLDVFTDKRFAGNPLAVVLEPIGLDDAAMQTIAREFNFPETVFVFPPTAGAGTRAAIRIFTPVRELPFAGHPTVGTTVLLGRIDGKDETMYGLETKFTALLCWVRSTGPDSGYASFKLPILPGPRGYSPGDNTAIAAALNIEPGDIGFDDFTPGFWFAGNPFACVPLKSLDAIRRCRAVEANWNAAFGGDDHNAAFMFCRQTEGGADFHARMFAPGYGIAEDPATGSAVAAFAGLLAASGRLGDGDHTVRVEQGYEMGRPSLIELTMTISGGRITTAAIGGSAVVVTEGTIEA
jgi:trans-2,3-dihydro-3-hydroxyanthranilate isomerase